MEDRWHRIKRKTPIYNVQKSKENKILTAKERLFTLLSKGELIAYGNKGIGIPKLDQGIDEFWRVRHLLCEEHESEYLAIPADFWDPAYVHLDNNYCFKLCATSYINIYINTAELVNLINFNYQEAAEKPDDNSKQKKYYTTEDIEFINFAAKYFFDIPTNQHFTKSSKKLTVKLQEKYKELIGRKLSDNKAKIIASFLKNENMDAKIIRRLKSLKNSL